MKNYLNNSILAGALMAFLFLGLYSANAQEIGITAPRNEMVPFWTTDQIVTGAGTTVLGSVVATAVTDWTGKKWLGVTSAIIVGAGVGFAKDKWDHAHNTAIPNSNPPFNDTIAGATGGAMGGVSFRIPVFTGRRSTWSKSGYNNRFRIFKRRR